MPGSKTPLKVHFAKGAISASPDIRGPLLNPFENSGEEAPNKRDDYGIHHATTSGILGWEACGGVFELQCQQL